MAFSFLSLEITAFLLLLRLSLLTAVQPSRHYDANQLLQWARYLNHFILHYERQIIDWGNKKAIAEEIAKELEDNLEIRALITGKSITKFVDCLYNTSENYYQPEIYRSTLHVCCSSST
ncbi:unnamed protein product [Trichobilharzia szidati]|nr:unnamed protein product [Trichobilharzia szidati]